jgi:hypothetical protein
MRNADIFPPIRSLRWRARPDSCHCMEAELRFLPIEIH